MASIKDETIGGFNAYLDTLNSEATRGSDWNLEKTFLAPTFQFRSF